ncbi:MAG: hypothetical protein GY701_28090, partial [Sulfitobacter sp.]|nr:hypothetical protein [Sulfitobacter sp.]
MTVASGAAIGGGAEYYAISGPNALMPAGGVTLDRVQSGGFTADQSGGFTTDSAAQQLAELLRQRDAQIAQMQKAIESAETRAQAAQQNAQQAHLREQDLT